MKTKLGRFVIVTTDGKREARVLTNAETYDLLVSIYGEDHAKSGMANMRNLESGCMSVNGAMIEFWGQAIAYAKPALGLPTECEGYGDLENV